MQMMLLAKDYLEKLGYTVVTRATIYNDKDSIGIIDVLGIKNGTKVGIECQVLPSHVVMEKKLAQFGPYLTKLVLGVANNVPVHDIPEKIEILTLPVEKPPSKMVQLQVMLDKKHDDIIRRNLKKKGDLGKRVEHALDLLDAEEQQT